MAKIQEQPVISTPDAALQRTLAEHAVQINRSPTTATHTVKPTVADDGSIGKGYAIGDIWINTNTKPVKAYMCLDATTGAAIWRLITLAEVFDDMSPDAFGRLRVSNPQTLFDSKLLGIDDQPLFWDEQLESGGGISASTPSAAKPYIDFTSSNTTAGVFTRQTFRRFNYQPGKSLLILMTGVLELASGTKTGCERRLGYFDDDNGAYFESDAGTIGVTTRTNDTSSPVDTTVAQTSWNLDNLDGDNDAANPSGITADWTKIQIFVIDFQWLSAGRVRFGVEIAGKLIYVHEVLTANTSTTPWTSTPCLPIRYQMITTTSSGVCSMRCVCAAVISEGGTDNIGVIRHKGTAGTAVTTVAENTLYAIVGIRLKTTHTGTWIEVINAELQTQTASEFLEWIVIFNPTVAGTFTYSGITNSSVEAALGTGSNTVTGGTHMGGGYLQSGTPSGGRGGRGGNTISNALTLGVAIDGTTQDTIVLCVRPIGGVDAADVEGALTWREIV